MNKEVEYIIMEETGEGAYEQIYHPLNKNTASTYYSQRSNKDNTYIFIDVTEKFNNSNLDDKISDNWIIDRKPTREDVSSDSYYNVIAINEDYTCKIINWKMVHENQPWMKIPGYKNELFFKKWDYKKLEQSKKQSKIDALKEQIKGNEKYIETLKKQLEEIS